MPDPCRFPIYKIDEEEDDEPDEEPSWRKDDEPEPENEDRSNRPYFPSAQPPTRHQMSESFSAAQQQQAVISQIDENAADDNTMDRLAELSGVK